MNSVWFLEWNIDQNQPSLIFSENDDRISFAVFPDIERSFVLFEGLLFDRHNYREKQNAPDAARIIEYYKLYKKDIFKNLRGAFSLVLWDADCHQLLTGRDHIGQIPLYYYWNHRTIIVSSSMRAILSRPNINNQFNRVVITEHILHRWPDHQQTETFFEEINRLPPAHYLQIKNRNLTSNRYWDPIPPGFDWATEKEAQTFPELFEQAVERTLKVGADSIALSGGFDSVSIAVMANELNQSQNNKPLHAISIRYINTGADEGEVQEAVAKALSMPQIMRSIDKSLSGISVLQASLDMSPISPIPVINIWQSFFSGLLDMASEYGYTKMLLGTGGDEMFIVDVNWARDLFTAFRFKELAHFYKSIAAASPFPPTEVMRVLLWQRAIKPTVISIARNFLGDLAPKIRRSILPNQPLFPAWISTSDRTLIEQMKYRIENPVQVEMNPQEGAYIRTIRRLPQSPLLMLEIEQAYFRARNSGFLFLYPYFDLDLMDLALRMRPEHLLRDGLVKSPLRRFVRERLPSVVLPKKKVDFTQTAHSLLRTEGKMAWQRLENAKKLEDLDIINRHGFENFINQYFGEVNNHWYYAWLTISTETWLRFYLND